jgi:hypothetical protein
LVAKTADLGQDAVLAVLAAMSATKYANVVDPLLTQEQIDALIRELAEDILASDGLESFLTVTMLVATLARAVGIGRVSLVRGTVVGGSNSGSH